MYVVSIKPVLQAVNEIIVLLHVKYSTHEALLL